MATVYIPKRFTGISETLARKALPATGRPVFDTFMHLYVFAALVGHANGRKEEVGDRGSEIEDRIFLNNKMDGIVYLLALQETKSADILRETHDSEVWGILQEYAAGGFAIIEDWMRENPTDLAGIDTLLMNMKQQAVANTQGADDPEPEIEVSF